MDTNIEVALALRVKMRISDDRWIIQGFHNDMTISENEKEVVLPDEIQNEIVNACAKEVSNIMLCNIGKEVDKNGWRLSDEDP